MPAEPADRPVLDPDDIAGHGFTKSRKGYEVDEVRAFLVGIGSRVREANQHQADLERRVAELERRAVDPKDLDADAVTKLLGEETGRVLETARKAAEEIRTRAATESEALTRAADTEATETREAADQYAEGTRAAADERAEQARSEADTYAAETRATADADTATVRSEADAYAAEVREAAAAEVAELRSTATSEVERLRAEAEAVLGERTAEAELAAGSIRADAEAYDGRVREEADRYGEATRSAADSYRADVQGAADAYRDAATTEGDRLRTEALADAEATRKEADADAIARREATEVEVESIIADAREQGRAMVQEARTYRERVIADLADRRRAARAQLEQLAATRDALAVTLSDVATRIESSHRSLQDAVLDPREIGDLAQDRRTLEAADQPGTSVGVGELEGLSDDEVLDGELSADDDPPADDDESVGTDAVGTDGPTDDTDAGAGAGAEDEVLAEGEVEIVDLTDAGLTVDQPVVLDDDDDEDPTDAEPEWAESEPEAPSEAGTDPDAAGEEASEAEAGESTVDDLFARLRAEQGEEGTEAEPADAGSVATAVASEVDEPVETQDVDGGADDGEEAVEDRDPDTDLLDRRDATTDEIERQLARRLKRILSDEQNEVLDLLRRTRGNPGAAEVLPSEADHLARYAAAAEEDLASAERAGAGFFGTAPRRTADVADVASEFAADMVRQIRGRLERSFDDGGDEQEVGERIRACYREWKTQRIADAARHYVVVAFSRGVAEAAADGATFRWLVDDGDAPCPDCDDNALAGANPKGEPFPTGDLCPPAHPGCRCLAVPVEAG